MTTRHEAGLEALDETIRPRVRLTLSCRDSDDLPKVPQAGQVVDHDGTPVQVMHNGVLVEAGGYFGDWMSTIIRGLRGHHEPQEERVFAAVLDRLAADEQPYPVMIEPGSFWAYYSIWFARRFPTGRVLAVEPDPANLALGRRNAALNGVGDRIDFRPGMVGPDAGVAVDFVCESSGERARPIQYDLPALLAAAGTDRVDLLAVDVQGAETDLLAGGRDLLEAGAVRFLVLSTHHHSISGDVLTHQRALALIRATGGHIVAEHTVAESFSGDGLIAASWDARDADLLVELSHARAAASFFPVLEEELAQTRGERDGLQARVDAADRQAAREARAAVAAATELAAVRGSLRWRLSERPARAYGWLARHAHRR